MPAGVYPDARPRAVAATNTSLGTMSVDSMM
jgi:hypothetical protein